MLQQMRFDVVHAQIPAQQQDVNFPSIRRRSNNLTTYSWTPAHQDFAMTCAPNLGAGLEITSQGDPFADDSNTAPAARKASVPPDRVILIGRGEGTSEFQTVPTSAECEQLFGIPKSNPVAWFTMPIITEKGCLEFLNTFEQTLKSVSYAHLLLASHVINSDWNL